MPGTSQIGKILIQSNSFQGTVGRLVGIAVHILRISFHNHWCRTPDLKG